MANDSSGASKVPPPPTTKNRAAGKTHVMSGAVPPPASGADPPTADKPRESRPTIVGQPAVAGPDQPLLPEEFDLPPVTEAAPEPPVPEPLAPEPPVDQAPRPTRPAHAKEPPEKGETKDFQKSRHSRVGTHIAGTEGLQVPGPEAPKLRLMAGKVVPGTRYRIIRWLGEGGMGVVYEAEHIDIERRVALKILRFDLSQQPRMVQVFRDEARAASRLGSQAIVEIYDFGELPDGRLFFCMELLDGSDLVPVSEEDSMEPGRLIGILRQACKGLAAAHRAGVVHRDVKPENVITVTRNERDDTVRIVDFGISSMLAASQQEEGGIAGTPHYMAPEQITGQSFDGRLDIYALGCTAYELLVGRPPFDADRLEDLLHAHLTEAPLPPREARPDCDIPEPVEKVIMKSLAKIAGNRYQTMEEFEAALCQAQIEAELRTPWDDLPLPELEDAERREWLSQNMPSLAMAEPEKRGLLWPLVAGASTLAAVGLGLFLAFGRGPTEQEQSQIDELTAQAKDAGAKGNYVYPPLKERDAPTSYRKVLELEAITGSAESAADDRGEDLRGEFSETLVGRADELWEIPGARRIARQAYVEALMFDDKLAVALERSGLDALALADFRDKIENGEFGEVELAIANFVKSLGEDDAAKQAAGAELAAAMENSDLPVGSQEGMLKGLRGSGVKGVGRRKGSRSGQSGGNGGGSGGAAAGGSGAAEGAANPDATAGAEAGEEELLIEEEDKKKKSSIRGRDVRSVIGKAKRDPKRAKDLAKQGMSALRSGKRQQAESLFNQSISHDRRNAMALMGLSDVYFDTGSNQKAVLYAEKAVKASPRTKNYRIKLGDAYFKVLRYQDALAQYREAKKLGSGKAAQRIAKVQSKTGG